MSAEAFPAFLPGPTGNFGGDVSSSVIRTPMDSGRVRQRRRYTRENRTYNVSWNFTGFEFKMFQSWFVNKISNGADSCSISLPVDGDGFKTVEAKFIEGKYSFAHTPNQPLYWTVSAKLFVEDADVLTDEEYTDLIPE